MPGELRPGVRVRTEELGPGTVVQVTPKGCIVALDKLNGLEVLQRETEISLLVPSDPAVPGIGAPPPLDFEPAPSLPAPYYQARRSLEALRFGIVPVLAIEELTLGFEELRIWVRNLLPGADGTRSRLSEICGPFGTGKSHTMAAIRRIAAADGYLTASVEVDGRGVTLSNPASVLHGLWQSVGVVGFESPTPFVDLNLRAIQAGKAAAIAALRPFERICSNLVTVVAVERAKCLEKHAEAMDSLMACGDNVKASALRSEMRRDVWAAGRDGYAVEPKALIGRDVAGRPADFAGCLLGYSVLARLAGFQGMVVTIDEFEVEYNLTNQTKQRLINVIRTLAERLSDRTQVKSVPLSVFIATVGQEGHLGDLIVEKLVEMTGGERHVLQPWPRAERRKLAERIFRLYREAYGVTEVFDGGLVDDVEDGLVQAALDGSGLIRTFIKSYVAQLDTLYGPSAS